jgi:hypothetical protein
MIGITTMVATAELACIWKAVDGKPYVGMDMNIRIVNEDHYEYGNDNFTMFADEGKHEKTESS